MRQPSVNPADIAACRDLLCSGSRSFFAASLLLPARVRAPATALYAFCRVADDAIDLGDDPAAALVQLYARLDAAYAGNPEPCAIDRAFAATVAAYNIPRTLPAALIEGLAWDAQGRRYENFAALQDYAARVAGAVGVMMAVVMGVRDAPALARAADLGIAMQLTNIARDVGEDARAGRLFLPSDWLQDAGIDARAFLNNPRFTPALGGVVMRLLDEADALYTRGAAGISRLPWDCRTGIAAAGRIYAAIGGEVAAAGYDSIACRARVTGGRKIGLALQALADTVWSATDNQMPALPANLFLVNAAAVAPETLQPQLTGFDWVMDLFLRLERGQREEMTRDGRLA